MKSRLWTDCRCLSGLAISETKTRHLCVLIRILVNWLYWINFAHTKHTLTLLFYVIFSDIMLSKNSITCFTKMLWSLLIFFLLDFNLLFLIDKLYSYYLVRHVLFYNCYIFINIISISVSISIIVGYIQVPRHAYRC